MIFDSGFISKITRDQMVLRTYINDAIDIAIFSEFFDLLAVVDLSLVCRLSLFSVSEK